MNTGGTFFIGVPDKVGGFHNSSALFNNDPWPTLCVDSSFSYDHSATDPDGDSLVYKLCRPYPGASNVNATPVPSPSKPYINLNYVPPYTFTNPLGGNDSLKIDPATGLLTGTPPAIGRYVVGICVEEYRNGLLLSKSMRDFQYHVVVCDSVFQAGFTHSVFNQFASFIAAANGQPVTWNWDFGDGNMDTVKNPVHEYMAIGSYNVCLIASHACGADTICDTVAITFIDTFGSIPKIIKKTGLIIWPIPTSNELYIQLPNNTHDLLVINIYNLLGKLVSIKTSALDDPTILRTNMLVSGSYFLELVDDGRIIGRARFIKD